MDFVSVTTTINLPRVIKLFAACDADMHFIVVGDRKTPDDGVIKLLAGTNHTYLSADHQKTLGYKCVDLIGENSIQKRNVGFLEALKYGAKYIYSFDDDNFSIALNHFEVFRDVLTQPWDGVEVSGVNGWLDVGQYLLPKSPHRGFPRQVKHVPRYGTVTGAKIGVAAGVCILDPDIDSVTRIANAPDVQQVSLLLEAGFVAHPNTKTVWNSQNTAVVRELIPAWGMVSHVSRMDDIYASIICHRVMLEHGYRTHFGRPFAGQERNRHNLVKDLRGEIDGYETVQKLADLLDNTPLLGKSILEDTRRIWETLNHAAFIPGRSVQTMMAYLDDVEKVL